MDPVLPFSLVMIALMAVKFRSFKLFDELLEHIHSAHPDQWEALGRPLGYFWRPDLPDVSTLHGMAARRRLTHAWLSATPDWMPEGGTEQVKLAAWRFTFWASWVGIAVVGAALAVLGLLST